MQINNPITLEIVDYIKEKFGMSPEFLWAKFPDNAAFRHKNGKWFAALILNLPKNKLGLNDSGAADVLNLKCEPILTASLVDGVRYFGGYHMNKAHWVTVLLDGTLPTNEIKAMIDMSYYTIDGKGKKNDNKNPKT